MSHDHPEWRFTRPGGEQGYYPRAPTWEEALLLLVQKHGGTFVLDTSRLPWKG